MAVELKFMGMVIRKNMSERPLRRDNEKQFEIHWSKVMLGGTP